MLTTNSLKVAASRISRRLEGDREMLNALDGQLGDGDLGVTLDKAFREICQQAETLPDDVGMALVRASALVTKVSSSSFGTLLATALLAAGSNAKGRKMIAPDEIAPLLETALGAMMARGKANLGDKTVLDGLASVISHLRDEPNPDILPQTAERGAQAAVEAIRDKPCRIGRARMFGERTVGIDDPGMVALCSMTSALTNGSPS